MKQYCHLATIIISLRSGKFNVWSVSTRPLARVKHSRSAKSGCKLLYSVYCFVYSCSAVVQLFRPRGGFAREIDTII